jgi:hypothetical protein
MWYDGLQNHLSIVGKKNLVFMTTKKQYYISQQNQKKYFTFTIVVIFSIAVVDHGDCILTTETCWTEPVIPGPSPISSFSIAMSLSFSIALNQVISFHCGG